MRFEARAIGFTHEYQIWDLVTGKPIGETAYTARDAYQVAADLDCQYTDTGLRDPRRVRVVDPPKRVAVRVIARQWRDDARLIRWLRESDQWCGLIRFGRDHSLGWWPADRIRLPGTQFD